MVVVGWLVGDDCQQLEVIDNDGVVYVYLQRRLLRVAVAARYAQSLVMGAYSYSQVRINLNQPFIVPFW